MESEVIRIFSERAIVRFCYMCGKVTLFPIFISVPCPNCMATYEIALCPECARKLKQELEKQLEQREKEMREVAEYLKKP